MLTPRSHAHPLRRSLAPARLVGLGARPGWISAGALALLCSTVAWASLPRGADLPSDQQRQWQALGVAPLSGGGATGLAMAPTGAAEPLEFVARRAYAPAPDITPEPRPAPSILGPIRIQGRAGDELYWSLRAAGASPQVAADYLAALATEIDVGEIGASDSFDLVLGRDRQLLYAGLQRVGQSPLQLVRWTQDGEPRWINAADTSTAAPATSGLMMPVDGHITSYFGYRYHPILHFTRFHAGLDIGAPWGTPIVAAGDGRVVAAGWAGGYGREVQIAHGGGFLSLYGHMSDIVAQAGSFVHAGQVIGYVGSSGLSTGPHVHFEVRLAGQPVNPLGVRLVRAPAVDTRITAEVRARLKTLLSTRAS